MAAAVGIISLSTVQGIWKARGLVPHRVRAFELSKDPEFISKLLDRRAGRYTIEKVRRGYRVPPVGPPGFLRRSGT